jgi:hypothetical protein
MREKIQDTIKNSILIKTPKNLIPIQAGTQSKWRHEISSRYERSQSIYGSETLKNGRNPYLTRSHSEEQLHNFLRPQRSIQPCFSLSNISELTGNIMGTTYGNAIRPERYPMGIHPNNKKMCNTDPRDLEDKMCSILGQLTTSTSKQKSFSEISPTNNSSPSILRMDS